MWVAASLPAQAGVRRAARWDGIAPIYSTANDFRPVTADEVATTVESIRARRADMANFDVVLFSIDLCSSTCSALEQAGATWIIGGPDPARFVDDAREMAAQGPPIS